MRVRVVFMLVLVGLVVAACGGNGAGGPGTTTSGGTTPTGGTPGPTGVTSPPPTQPPSSGGDSGSVTVELEGTTYELSTSKTIPFPAAPDTMIPTRCEPSFFNTGLFWVLAIAIDDAGKVLQPGYSLKIDLYASGEIDDSGFQFTIDADDREYSLIRDDPGSWTVSGNRIHGEVNVGYWVGGAEQKTTARFDVTCPSG